MGSHSFTTDCHKCGGKETIFACNETRTPHQSGDCLKCGYSYWTEEGQLTPEELKELRETVGWEE